MEPSLKLDTAVGLLVRRSTHRVVDEEGNPRFVVADPLLVQLRMAAANSASIGGGGGSSGAAPIPISADAHDLLEQIREETTRQWWLTYGIHRGAGKGTLGGELMTWVGVAKTDAALTAVAANVTWRWVMDIKTLFNPNLRRAFPGTCKICGAARVLDREESGEHFYKPVLVKEYDEDGALLTVECTNCGSSWTGEGIKELAK